MKLDRRPESTTTANRHADSFISRKDSGHNLLHTVHQTMGNRAVQRMLANSDSPVQGYPGTNVSNGLMVQRLIDTNTFKKQTSVSYKMRSKIKSVDTALADYHKLGENEYAKRSAQLDLIIQECDTYLLHPKAHQDRVPGVEQLRQQASKEHEVFRLLAEAESETGTQQFYKLRDAQDTWLTVKDSVPGLQRFVFSPLFDKCIVELRKLPGAMEEVLDSELDQLMAIMADSDTPDITRTVLAEVLSNLNEIKMKNLTPGARFTNDSERRQGVTEKYVVNHNLNAPGGSAERLGSLAHELTHVSVSEQFDNTALFFAFDKNASEDEVMDLVHKRHQDLDMLLALVGSSGFTQEQLALLHMKLEYPRKGGASGVQRYISSFFQSNKITLEDKRRAESLVNKGMDNTVIEFDTVMNQMLIYMQQWKIPIDNPFYVQLQTVAEEAFNHRMG